MKKPTSKSLIKTTSIFNTKGLEKYVGGRLNIGVRITWLDKTEILTISEFVANRFDSITNKYLGKEFELHGSLWKVSLVDDFKFYTSSGVATCKLKLTQANPIIRKRLLTDREVRKIYESRLPEFTGFQKLLNAKLSAYNEQPHKYINVITRTIEEKRAIVYKMKAHYLNNFKTK